MPVTRVLVDANVLYSKTLRDWLALIYLSGDGEIYEVYWTEDIVTEALHSLRRDHPTWDGRKINKVRQQITSTFEGGRVEDFVIDGSFQGSDVNDAHVHAAACACDADILLTCDSGFNGAGVDPDLLPYEVYAPDEFFVLVNDSAPDRVAEVTRDQTQYWVDKEGRARLADKLAAAGCTQFAEIVRSYQAQLSLSPSPNSLGY